MKSRWSTLTCIALVTGTAGFLAGFLTTFTADPLSEDPEWTSTPTAAGPPMLIPLPAGESPGPGAAGSPDDLMYFPQTVLAEAEALAPEESPSRAPRGSEPGMLPEPSSTATPLSALPAQPSGLEQLIDSEFGDLSAQQREVWIEVLGGLPLEDAAGILRIWKQLGRGPDSDEPSDLTSAAPGRTNAPSINAHAADPHDPARKHPAPDALQHTRELLIRNLLNAHTHGYRRCEPLLSDMPAFMSPAAPPVHELTSVEGAAPHPAAVAFDGWRIDQRPGTIQSTGNSLDVAISGAGFFVVMVDEATFYTRCGRFRLDEERRIILDQPRHAAVLQPELRVPSDADEIWIDRDGTVRAVSHDEQPQTLGRLELATFRDAGRLRPVGNTLFEATMESGPADIRAAQSTGTGELQQGAIESANVDIESELSRLEWLDRLARSLE